MPSFCHSDRKRVRFVRKDCRIFGDKRRRTRIGIVMFAVKKKEKLARIHKKVKRDWIFN